MNPASPHPLPRRSRLESRFVSLTELDRDEIVDRTNRHGAHHLDMCTDGDEVVLVGRVTAVTLPGAVYVNNRTTQLPPYASVTLDDGTGMVDFSVPREDALRLVGALVEVSGRVFKSTTSGRWDLTEARVAILPG